MGMFDCEICGQRIRIPDGHAGKRARCKGCGQIFSIPPLAHTSLGEASADVGTSRNTGNSGDHATTSDVKRLSDSERRIIRCGVIAAIILILVLPAALVLPGLIHDWRTERAWAAVEPNVQQLLERAQSEADSFYYSQANATLKNAFDAINKGNLSEDQMNTLKDTIEISRRKIQLASEEYQRNVDSGYLVVDGQLLSPEEQKAKAARQDAERKRAEAQARREADRRVLEERASAVREKASADQREMEIRASIRGSLAGAAWITRGNGQSEILRGMHVYLLRPRLPKENIDPIYQDVQKLLDASVEDIRRWQGNFQRNVRYSENLFNENLKAVESIRNDLLTNPDARGDVAKLFKAIRTAQVARENTDPIGVVSHYAQDKIWPKIVASAAVMRTETNIEGKYEIVEIPWGTYYVYAVNESAFSIVEWLPSCNVTDSASYSFNFQNNNATFICNKRIK
jgi:sRNA-binding protein